MGSLSQCKLEGFICRLCSLLNRDKDIIHIYGEEGKSKNLEHKINIYLQINLSKYDPLPKTICGSCDLKLEQHHRFMQRVIENQRKIEKRQEALQSARMEINRLVSLHENIETVMAPSTSRAAQSIVEEANTNTLQSSDDSSDSDDDDSDYVENVEAAGNEEEEEEVLIDENDSDYEDIVDHLRNESNADLHR